MDIRLLEVSDLSFCDELSGLAGWNQKRSDWLRFLRFSRDGCFVAEVDGKRAGTVTTMCYGRSIGWIGMLIVHPDFRGRGVGTALLQHAVDLLKPKVSAIKLDATPEGEPLYRRIGFRDEFRITRWQREPQRHGVESSAKMIRLEDWATITQMDEEAFGAPRETLLRYLAAHASSTWVERDGGRIRGFGMLRPGSRANYLGPIAAENPNVAMGFISGLPLAACDRPVFWDLPVLPGRSALPESLHFTPQRTLLRMSLGGAILARQPEMYWGLVDPACG